MFIAEYNVLLQAGRHQSQVTSKESIQDHSEPRGRAGPANSARTSSGTAAPGKRHLTTAGGLSLSHSGIC